MKNWPVIGEKLHEAWFAASVNLKQAVVRYKDQLLVVGRVVLAGVVSAGGGVLQIIAAVIVAGVLLCTKGTSDSTHIIFTKLAGERGDELSGIISKTVGNVIKGILGVAFIQSVLIGIGFLLAGIPYAGLWTLLIFVLTVLQIPQALVVIPAAIYLFSAKAMTPAIGWTVYLMLIGLSDNLLKPILLGKGAPVPMLVIFLGVIGGFMLSGLIGLFTGAIVMSVGYKLFLAWLDDGRCACPDR